MRSMGITRSVPPHLCSGLLQYQVSCSVVHSSVRLNAAIGSLSRFLSIRTYYRDFPRFEDLLQKAETEKTDDGMYLI